MCFSNHYVLIICLEEYEYEYRPSPQPRTTVKTDLDNTSSATRVSDGEIAAEAETSELNYIHTSIAKQTPSSPISISNATSSHSHGQQDVDSIADRFGGARISEQDPWVDRQHIRATSNDKHEKFDKSIYILHLRVPH